MKQCKRALSGALALLLSLSLVLPCLAQEDADSIAPEAALSTADSSAPESAPEAEGSTSEDVLKTEDAEDSAASQDAYTLPVQSGDDITSELRSAAEDHAQIILPQGTYTAGFLKFSGLSNVSIDGSGSTIRSTTSSDHGMGIYQCTNFNLSNLTLTNAGRHGIYVSDSTGTFTAVTVKESYWSGLVGKYPETNITLRDCLFQHNGMRPRSTVQYDDSLAAGLAVDQGAVVNVIDCTCEDNIASGVMITSKDPDNIPTVNFYGVVLKNNGDHGVGACPLSHFNMQKSDKRRCLVEGNAHNGVQAIDRCTCDFIKDTDMIGNGQDGLSIGIGSTVKLVENCTMVNNKKHGMMVRRDSIVKKVNKCSLTGNAAYGILLNCETGTKKTTVSVSNSKLNKNSKDGLRILGKSGSATVKKCTVSGNKGSGIVVQDKAKLSSLINTKVTKNSKYGIRVYSKCTVGSTSGSSFSGNKGKQIYVDKGASTKLKTKK